MPKRIALVAIGVTRNGKTIYPEIGKSFDFTAEEVAELNALGKASKIAHIRVPVNEDPTGGNEEPGDGPVDLSTLKLAELRAEADTRGVDISELGEKATKAQIIEALNAAANVEEEDL